MESRIESEWFRSWRRWLEVWLMVISAENYQVEAKRANRFRLSQSHVVIIRPD